MQYTDNMELLLYEANDIMQTTDFVNTNNQKIDEFTAAVKTTAEEASASASQANQGVSAADKKIQQIQTSITQNELSSLPQFKQDTEDRLTTLEDDVAGLSGWSTPFTNPNGDITDSIQISSIGLWTSDHRVDVSSWVPVTETMKNYFNKGVYSTYNRKMLRGTVSGNIFNIPEVNTIFFVNVNSTDYDGTLRSAGYGLKWTGVVTEFYDLTSYSSSQYMSEAMMPIVKMR